MTEMDGGILGDLWMLMAETNTSGVSGFWMQFTSCTSPGPGPLAAMQFGVSGDVFIIIGG